MNKADPQPILRETAAARVQHEEVRIHAPSDAAPHGIAEIPGKEQRPGEHPFQWRKDHLLAAGAVRQELGLGNRLHGPVFQAIELEHAKSDQLSNVSAAVGLFVIAGPCLPKRDRLGCADITRQ